MPDSASGVSITLASPKSFCSPSVTRKTPPSLPTSSPMTSTLGSFSSALRRPSLIALDRLSLVIWPPLAQRTTQGRRRTAPAPPAAACSVGVHVLEYRQRRRVGHLQAGPPDLPAQL